MTSRSGLLLGVAAYALWGVLPVYWKALGSVPAFEVLCHRMVWSLVCLLGVCLIRDRGRRIRAAMGEPGNWWRFGLSAVLLGGNWFVYIWAVQQGRIVDTSLGYFLNPLVTMGLGMAVLGERLRGRQWISVGFAAAGVLWLTLAYGSLPWVSVFLAVSFALYTLMRKLASLGSLDGLVFEGLVLLAPALGWLVWLQSQGSAAFLRHGPGTDLLLIGAGVATSVPLLLFNAATRRVELVSIGLLQYLAPTLQFLIGVFLYGEPFQGTRLVGFGLIWLGILVYVADLLTRVPASADGEYPGTPLPEDCSAPSKSPLPLNSGSG